MTGQKLTAAQQREQMQKPLLLGQLVAIDNGNLGNQWYRDKTWGNKINLNINSIYGVLVEKYLQKTN